MKKLTFWRIAMIVSLFNLSVMSMFSCGDKTTKVTTDPCAEMFKELTASQHQVLDLQTQIGDLKAENARLQAELDCLNSKVTITKTTNTRSYTSPKKTTTTPKVVSSTVTTKSATIPANTAPTDTKFVSNAIGGTANLDYLREGKDIIFCAQANNREDCYFPHYAMQHGVMFSKAPEDNEIKGYNWRVEPTEFYDGDYGVTVDGTFYVSDNLIQQSMKAGSLSFEAPLRIKCPYTSWMAKDMTLEDGYWIFKTQRK
jgi:regulator of replication initiation timing